MVKIFIVEDDAKLREELIKLLERYGYACAYSDDFKNIVEKCLVSGADLVLLDINLPYFDGFHVCREIRKQSDVPIIVVTSRDSEADELMGMNIGADDFVTKPYNTQILLARIAALLNRSAKKDAGSVLEHGGLVLDTAKSTVSFADMGTELTKNEERILYALMQKRGSIVTRDELINELWQTDLFIDDNTLTVNVNRLRKKLAEIGAEDFIKTRRGQGYMV